MKAFKKLNVTNFNALAPINRHMFDNMTAEITPKLGW